MKDLRKELIEASRNNELLAKVPDFYRKDRTLLVQQLIKLHNEGSLDLITQALQLENNAHPPYKFFLVRNVVEEAIPGLKAPVESVMECIAHLVSESGQDMSAGTPFNAFISFCKADQSRPGDALCAINQSPKKWIDFIVAVIVAGTHFEMDKFFREAIRLTNSDQPDIRSRATYALGRIDYPRGSTLPLAALAKLEELAQQESDDNMLANMLYSLCNISKLLAPGQDLDRCVLALDSSLTKGENLTLYSAARQFAYGIEELPPGVIQLLFDHLKMVNPSHGDTLRMVDYGLCQLMGKGTGLGMEFLERLLLEHPEDLSVEALDGTVHLITTSDNRLLDKLLTRWFQGGVPILCNAIAEMVNIAHDEAMNLQIDTTELTDTDLDHLCYLARKTIGYLFITPVTCASIIISLMKVTGDAPTIEAMGRLLYDPLLINFPGDMREYLANQSEKEPGAVQQEIVKVIALIDAYLNDIKLVADVRELCPSLGQEEAHRRHTQQLLSESYKEAMKDSFINMVSKRVLLYGSKSIEYVREEEGEPERIEIPLISHETSMNIPRESYLDPIGLAYRRFMFRLERMVVN